MKKVISVNVAILGSFSESRVNLAKWNGNLIDSSWNYRISEIKRMLAFGNIGRRLIGEDIAKSLNTGFPIAREILEEIEKTI